MPSPVIELLETRRLLTGVTIIAHGYGGNVSGWVSTMADAIASQNGSLADQPRYKMTVTDPGHDGGPLTVASTRLGPALASWGSQEILVLLDWTDIAGSFPFGYTRNTFDVGAAVAAKLLANLSIPDLVTPLAQLPMHFIGHSRGASVISEIAKGLGQRGVWVDQLTYNDPHPVDGINEPFGLNFGDAPMRVYDNVQFADDYWRTDGGSSFDFTGEAVNGAFNLQLSESILAGAGYSGAEHSDTHLWYHGTIGPPYQNSDGDPDGDIGANWYNAPQGPRDQIGWRYSRLGKGTRPAGGLKSSGAHRDTVALTVSGAGVWDNIAISNLLYDATVSQGTPIAVNTLFEDRSVGGLRDSTITIGFDRDDNPFNGVFGSGVQFVTSSLGSDVLNASLPTTNIAGAYRIYARISNGTNTRYYYAPGRQIITVPGYEKTWIGAATGDWSVGSNWSSSGVPTATDHVAIFDADVELNLTAKVAGLLIGGAGSLDLNDNDLIVDYSGVSPIGTWNGSVYDGISGYVASGAIRSSSIGTTGLYALGVANAIDVLTLSPTALWSGQTVDSSSVLVKFTYGGDANLSGYIDIDDYGQIDSNASLGGSLIGWFNGDFDYNGVSDIDDYGVIDSIIGIQGPPL